MVICCSSGQSVDYCGQPEISTQNNKIREAGFTYLGLMFALAIAGIAMAGTGVLWHMEGLREKEKQLLFFGEEYRRAINSYYEKSPGAQKQHPQKLEELLLDTRSPNVVRHLRRLYLEPMMEDGQWGVLRQQGRIVGVVSRSQSSPIKVAGFLLGQEEFEGATSYSEWRFVSNGAGASAGMGGVGEFNVPDRENGAGIPTELKPVN